jgi:hypothetical protein
MAGRSPGSLRMLAILRLNTTLLELLFLVSLAAARQA